MKLRPPPAAHQSGAEGVSPGHKAPSFAMRSAAPSDGIVSGEARRSQTNHSLKGLKSTPLSSTLLTNNLAETNAPGRVDSTFEQHFSIQDLSKIWKLSRETIRQLVKEEPDVLKVRLGRYKAMTRYSIPASVARRIHTRLFNSL